MVDLTRTNELAQKKSICVFAGQINEGTERGEVESADGNHLLGNLPPDAIILDAFIHVKTASDAATSATGTLGTASAGTQILSAADLKTTGDSGTFTGQSLTGTGKEVWLGLAYVGANTDVGEYIVVVEYLEYEKNTGEYTRF